MILYYVRILFLRLIQSVFLLPRYLERNHELITKSLAQHSITDEELKAFEEEEQREKQKPEEEKSQNAEEQSEETAELKKTN